VMPHRLGSKFFSWPSWQRIQQCKPQQPFCTVICCGKRVPERKTTHLKKYVNQIIQHGKLHY
jgi:hypothetical protein